MPRFSFPESFSIDGRSVGPGLPTYVIAEAGANHNSDLDLARRLIDVAADARADAVKFQVYSGKSLYSSKTPSFQYLKDVAAERPVHELLEDVALPREWIGELVTHARDRGLPFFATPFDADAVQELADAGVPVLKIASFEIVDLELIATAAATGLPLIISCGMATYGEIEDALDAVADAGGRQVALLQCASLYPAPPGIMNLRAMQTMHSAFGLPVGLSDHTTGNAVALGARGLGMQLLEKHFTLDRGMAGPDHPFAIEPDELTQLVAGVRAVEEALGTGRLDGPSELEEREMYRLARRSVIAARDIPAGTMIARRDLVVKRPGFGIKPKYIDHVVGRHARVDIEFDEVITWEMV
jgi:N,N'-diacetyllegionaminate synthase